MNRLITISAVSTFLLFSVNAFAGPAAKFAATYSDTGWPSLAVVSESNSVTNPNSCDGHNGYTLATIKVPQDKELLVGLSAEVLLVTDTSIKGKDGGSARALAYSSGYVTIAACPANTFDDCVIAKPGTISLSDRFQILEGTLGGVLTSCTDSNGDGDIDLSDCELTDEEISLVLDTFSSHHFNFVLPNMDQGEYDVIAVFGTEACNEISSTVDAEALAYAKAGIGKYMLTVQQVRATSDGIIDMEIVE